VPQNRGMSLRDHIVAVSILKALEALFSHSFTPRQSGSDLSCSFCCVPCVLFCVRPDSVSLGLISSGAPSSGH